LDAASIAEGALATSPAIAAEALRRVQSPAAESVLLKGLAAGDPFVQQAARDGLRQALNHKRLVALLKNDDPSVRRGALLVLREAGGPSVEAVNAGLADSDPSVRFVAVQWVGEERLERFRVGLREGLSSGSATRQLFEAYLVALERLDGTLRDARDEQAGEGYIAALVADPKTPASVLLRGLRMLRPDHPALSLKRLVGLVASADPGLRLEAVRTLRDRPENERFDHLVRLAENPSEPVSLRAEAVIGLAADAERRKETLLTLAEGNDSILRHEALRSLRGVTLTQAENERAARFGRIDHEAASLLGFLSGPNAGQELPSEEPLAAWVARLEGLADPASGERVFFHPKGPGCYRCHTIDGRGGRGGPDLSVTPRTLTRERLIESVVSPSKEIAPQFVTWLVARSDGTVFTGVLLDQSVDGVATYVDALGREIRVKSADITDRRPQTTSIMPADLARLMTAREFRDLVAFLQGRGAGR
jgi:putative heme-binding domain-containing protein